MTDLTASAMLEQPTVGRSLWGDAWARLKANRAAMVSLFYLALVTIVCIVGPLFVPHQYTTIYADYIFPDLHSLERWEFQGSHPNMPIKIQPIRQPVMPCDLEKPRSVIVLSYSTPGLTVASASP